MEQESRKLLETDRLILRPWQDADRAPFAAIVGDPHVMRYYPNTRDRAGADAWVDKMMAELTQAPRPSLPPSGNPTANCSG